ncbi:MAG TPA: hypothetical protein VGB53_11550 [Rubricoccaceae bacterium]|jgi:hypothetical protein
MLRSSVLVALALLAIVPAEAQVIRRPTRRIVSRPWGAPAEAPASAPAAQTSDARAAAAPVDPQPSDATPAAAEAPAPAVALTAPSGSPAAVEVFGRTGLRVTLPAGWSSAADESRLPAYALYTFTPAGVTGRSAPGALAGVTLRVEQLTGLNPAEEQGWRTGQARVGYHGARPVGLAQVPVEALAAVETAGPGTGGATAFVQRGRTFWAVSVQAPAATWRANRAAVVGLMAGVALPAASAPPTGASATGATGTASEVPATRRYPTARR